MFGKGGGLRLILFVVERNGVPPIQYFCKIATLTTNEVLSEI
jgi:hypothetical protein